MNVSFHIVAISAFKHNWETTDIQLPEPQINMSIFVQVQLLVARAASSFILEVCVCAKFLTNM